MREITVGCREFNFFMLNSFMDFWLRIKILRQKLNTLFMFSLCMTDYNYHVKNFQKVSSKSKQYIFKIINM
jgi:hypothetical protein